MATATIGSAATEARDLPGPPVSQQVAPLRQIFTQPHPVLDELAATYGPCFRLGFGPVRMAVLGDPTVIADLLAMPVASFRWGHPFNVIGFVTGPTSLIVSDGPDWKRRRSSVQSAFSRRRINRWIPTIVDQTDATIDALVADLDGRTEVRDLYPVGRSLVLQIVVRTLFGDRMAQRAPEIGELMQRPQDYLESPAIKQLPHPFPRTARRGPRRPRRVRVVDR